MTTNAHANTPGPELLEERTLSGIFVHLLAVLPVGLPFVIALFVVADHPYTVENARNALNWHLTIVGLFLLLLPLAFFVWDGFVIPAAIVFLIGGTLGWIYAIVATAKAIFGTVWTYPLAPELL